MGALDPTFGLPDDRLLCVPTNDKDKELAFPSPAAAGWGNATFLAMCMKLAYEVSPGTAVGLSTGSTDLGSTALLRGCVGTPAGVCSWTAENTQRLRA